MVTDSLTPESVFAYPENTHRRIRNLKMKSKFDKLSAVLF